MKYKETQNKLVRVFLITMVAILISMSSAAYAETLRRVETKLVCMVNNKLFEKEQIPTFVEGKTYYGCCEMCASRLTSDRAIRKAVDPVSGKEVDKAMAIIGADGQGKTYYFENEKNLHLFSQKLG